MFLLCNAEGLVKGCRVSWPGVSSSSLTLGTTSVIDPLNSSLLSACMNYRTSLAYLQKHFLFHPRPLWDSPRTDTIAFKESSVSDHTIESL